MTAVSSGFGFTARGDEIQTGWLVTPKTWNTLKESGTLTAMRRRALKRKYYEMCSEPCGEAIISPHRTDNAFTGFRELKKGAVIVLGHFNESETVPDKICIVKYNGNPDDYGWTKAEDGRILPRVDGEHLRWTAV